MSRFPTSVTLLAKCSRRLTNSAGHLMGQAYAEPVVRRRVLHLRVRPVVHREDELSGAAFNIGDSCRAVHTLCRVGSRSQSRHARREHAATCACGGCRSSRDISVLPSAAGCALGSSGIHGVSRKHTVSRRLAQVTLVPRRRATGPSSQSHRMAP